MANGRKCGLACGTGTIVDTASPIIIHTVPVVVPGRNRGHYLHLDLINGGVAATDITLVIASTTVTINLPTKSVTQFDFFVPADSTPVDVTAQAISAGVVAIGFHERW